MIFAAATLSALLAGADAPSLADRQAAELDERILAELGAAAPAAVPDARAAAEAYGAGRWQEAFDAYGRVLADAPRFPHALRRQCTARLALGDREGARPLCRAALNAAPTAVNRVALASVLATSPGPRGDVTWIERGEAIALARGALREAPADVGVAWVACEVALRVDDRSLLKACSDRLLSLAPGELAAEYFATISSLLHEEYRAARRHLARARAAGLDARAARRLAADIDEREPPGAVVALAALVVLGAWAAVLALLLAAAAILSRITLGRARRLATEPSPGDARGALGLRRVYAAVLWLTSAVYYLSLPLVAGLVVAAGYGVWLLLAALGRIPTFVVVAILLTVIVSLWALLKGVWVSVIRAKGKDPGLRLDPAEHPRFQGALEEAAARVGTRRVDAVFVTPGTEVSVYERGGLFRRLARRTERRLILGVGLLDGMTQGQLKSVLAHEYGHFVNEDTAGGRFALAARRSMVELADALASGGAAAWYNPAWQFVTRFHALFLRVSHGASRLQEILADRRAALAYGGKTFAAGLTHVVTRSVRFEKHVDATLDEVEEGSVAPPPNLYRHVPANPPDEREVSEEVEREMNAGPSPYDSHPRPADRIAWVAEVAAAHAGDLDHDAPAWRLFWDREALERTLTQEVLAGLAAQREEDLPPEAPAPEGAPGA